MEIFEAMAGPGARRRGSDQPARRLSLRESIVEPTRGARSDVFTLPAVARVNCAPIVSTKFVSGTDIVCLRRRLVRARSSHARRRCQRDPQSGSRRQGVPRPARGSAVGARVCARCVPHLRWKKCASSNGRRRLPQVSDRNLSWSERVEPIAQALSPHFAADFGPRATGIGLIVAAFAQLSRASALRR